MTRGVVQHTDPTDASSAADRLDDEDSRAYSMGRAAGILSSPKPHVGLSSAAVACQLAEERSVR
ncbi:hypothetical protein K8O92_06830 [Nocardia asteroides]|nr:hypothetical protein K8O92_06830 [Nocardia asteroides]